MLDKPKRIAIQFFGHLRTFEQTYESFKKHVIDSNQVDNWEIDIFIHTWNELDHNTINHRSTTPTEEIEKRIPNIDLVTSLYQPKKISIEPQIQCDEYIITEKIGRGPRSIRGCKNMAYTLYRSSHLRQEYEKENNIKYDWVIVTRPDVLFLTDFNINYIFQLYTTWDLPIPENAIFHAYSPFGRGHMVEEPQFIAASDILYIAKPDIVDKATSLYENFDDNIDLENFYCMEVWWVTFWRKQGISPYPINFIDETNWILLRPIQISQIRKKNKQLLSSFKKYIRCLMPPIVRNIYKKLKDKGSTR